MLNRHRDVEEVLRQHGGRLAKFTGTPEKLLRGQPFGPDQIWNMPPESPDEVKGLVKAIHKADMGSKEHLLELLIQAFSGTVQLQPAYRELLNDKDKDVQAAAIEAVAKMGLKDAIPKIRNFLAQQPRNKLSEKLGIHSLEQAKDMAYTRVAAEALVELDDFGSVDELISRDYFMMNMPGIVLSKFGAKVLPKVLQHSKDGKPQRSGARSTIGQMRDEEAVPALVDILNGLDYDFAADAAQALSAIGNETKSDEIRRIVLAQLLAHLKHPDPHVRTAVYGGLLALDAAKYGPQILEALAHENGTARLNVLYAISNYRAKGVTPFLEQFIKKDEKWNPGPYSTDLRALAARMLFRTTGKRVPYKGIENEFRKSKDPYEDEY